jgi:phosphoribosylformylglycinamidine cyclo-ligase
MTTQSKIQNPKSEICSGISYQRTGVDIEAADGWLARMRPLIRSTHRAGVLPDRGQFAGLFRLATVRVRDPVLVASTDGVGTKLRVAQLVEPWGRHPERAHGPSRRVSRRINAHEAIGIDAVAMNANDVLVYGAQPLFFLDYIALGQLQPVLMRHLLKGIVRGCRLSGCALLGGETAEMPGVYRRGEYDVAGFCIGVVERAKLIRGSSVRAGDLIVGLASSGVHANGFSLVRHVFTKSQLLRLRHQLLTPTRIYVKPVLQALAHVSIHAMTHVTGGGLSRRIPSLVSGCRGVRARLVTNSWRIPPIFRTIQEAGHISMGEMLATFNMGIGMALVCRPPDAGRVVRIMQGAGIPAWSIGMIESARRVGSDTESPLCSPSVSDP